MTHAMLAGLVTIGLLAGGQGTPSEKVGAAQVGTSSTRTTLTAGTAVDVTTSRTITSRSDSVGESLQATVNTDVKSSAGRTVIPAGSTIELVITDSSPAKTKSAKDGTLTLRVGDVTVHGDSYPLAAEVTAVSHDLKGRGVTAGEVEKTAAGTAGGAIVANETACRDVVIPAGSPIEVTLTGPLTLEPS